MTTVIHSTTYGAVCSVARKKVEHGYLLFHDFGNSWLSLWQYNTVTLNTFFGLFHYYSIFSTVRMLYPVSACQGSHSSTDKKSRTFLGLSKTAMKTFP